MQGSDLNSEVFLKLLPKFVIVSYVKIVLTLNDLIKNFTVSYLQEIRFQDSQPKIETTDSTEHYINMYYVFPIRTYL